MEGKDEGDKVSPIILVYKGKRNDRLVLKGLHFEISFTETEDHTINLYFL